MSSSRINPLACLGVIVACATSACSGASSGSGFSSDPDAGEPGSGGGGTGGGSGNGGAPGGNLGVGGPSDGGSSTSGGTTLLYAHTDNTLYTFDPLDIAAAPTKLGTFDCVGTGMVKSMTDFAVTKDGKMFGVSEGAAFPLTVKGGTVHCEATWSLPATKFYGLTVAPENTVAATETLVGADGNGGLWLIDQNSGTPTQVGTLGTDPKTNTAWGLSGDIVFLANGGSPVGFATVRACPKGNCSTTDTLIEVDVSAIKPGTQSVMKSVRGQVVKGSWCTNTSSPNTFGSMFGIAAFEDKVYGFSRKGDVVEIRNSDGSGCLVSSNSSTLFAGAGVTTTAPVIAPGPK
jgi:hypothetical protein